MGRSITLTDVTASTWATISQPPNGTAVPVHASALCLRDTALCKRDTADRVFDKPWFARNSDWEPGPLVAVSSPISWPFMRPSLFKTAARAKGDVLDLAFVAQPVSGYNVKIYQVGYKSAVGLPPQVIGVAYPKDLDISKPPPFLVHFKHIPGQDPNATYFKYFDPFGYDWLFWEIWNYIVFNGVSNPGGVSPVDMPFLSPQQNSVGFTYQLRQANKQYVVVFPQVIRGFDPTTKQLLNYQMYSAVLLREALLEIQKDILSIKDEQLSHVALSASSSGCNVLAGFLQNNLSNMSKDPATAIFMKEEFNELFIFDPPEDFADAMIRALAPWANLTSSRSGFLGKCVRFYTHTYLNTMAGLAGLKASPFTKGKNELWESSSKAVSLVYLPFSKDGNDVWTRTYNAIISGGRLPVSNFRFVHHVIPALFLTDAARRSTYV